MSDEPQLKEIHDFLIDVAKKAGEMIIAANPSTVTADSKKNCMRATPILAIVFGEALLMPACL